jgi:pimeloyl-ACP methyl ester carboxylesterase
MAFLASDDVTLFYDDRGSGARPLVLVPGWACDHRHFAPQAEYFSASRRVVSVDLRGHGQSAAGDGYTIGAFAGDVAWLCQSLEIERPVVIGHSMGGMVAVELAAEHPDLVHAAIAVDTLFTPGGALLEAMDPVITAFRGPDYVAARRELVETLFGPYDSPALRDDVCAAICSVAPDVGEAFTSLLEWDGVAALRKARVPVLAITTEAGGTTDAASLAADCHRLFTGLTVGAGHFAQLEVPGQVNAMIERFLAIVD